MAPSEISFQDHLHELRRRVMWVILAIGLSGGIAYVIRTRMIKVLQHPLGAPLVYTSPAGSFNFVLKLSFIIGTFVALPVALYHILRFIEPALPARIRRWLMVKVIGASFLLAVAGICFGFFLMVPMSLHFFAGYSTAQIKPLITADEYLSFVLNHMLTFAIAFQIPMIFLFINRIKPLRPSKLLKYQRHVIVGSFALAIILPFTYDPLSQFIVAIPIIVLYYLSILLLWFANRGKKYAVPMAAKTIQPQITPQTPTPSVPNLEYQIQSIAPKPATVWSTDGFVRAQVVKTSPEPTKAVMPRLSSQQQSRLAKRRGLSIDGINPVLPSPI